MNGIEIRNATTQDLPIILDLLYKLGRPKPNDDQEKLVFGKKITQYLSDSDKQILVALINSKIIGFVSMIFLPRLNRINFEMYIPELIVLEKYQKKGIGKKLINSCIDLAKKKKCYRIRLESGNQRKGSHQFYTNLGFEQSSLSFTKNLNY